MRCPLLCAVALSLACWRGLPSAGAEEISLTMGMSYDKAIEAIQKCGGQDTGYLLLATGLSWWLGDYGVSLGIAEHYGKLNHLEYATTHNVTLIGDTGQRVEGQPAQSLTFDTDKRTFKAVNLPPASAPPPEHRWLTRTEVLFVALPTEKALAWLPDLRDESKVDATYGQLIAAIERKEARLIGDPVVYTPSDQKATTEAIFEKIYPTQYEVPSAPQNPGASAVPATAHYDSVPTAFEKRNAGVTVEVEPKVRDERGQRVQVLMSAQHVEYDGMDAFQFQRGPDVTGKIEQPRFFTNKESFETTIRSGQRVLIGAHKSQHTDEIELHVLQVTVTPGF